MKIINKKLLNQRPDAILFDTDNTLYPYEKANQIATEAVKNKVVRSFSISSEEFELSF